MSCKIVCKNSQMTCNFRRGSWEVSKKVEYLTVGPLELPEKLCGGWWVGGGLFDFTVSKVQVLLDLKTLDLTLDFDLTLDLDFRLTTLTNFAFLPCLYCIITQNILYRFKINTNKTWVSLVSTFHFYLYILCREEKYQVLTFSRKIKSGTWQK